MRYPETRMPIAEETEFITPPELPETDALSLGKLHGTF